MGRDADADTVMDRAIKLPDTDAPSVHRYGLAMLAAGRKDRAMRVFEANRRLHPADKFWPYVGLARGYTALGRRKAAIASWDVALKHVPRDQQANLPNLEKAAQALRSSR